MFLNRKRAYESFIFIALQLGKTKKSDILEPTLSYLTGNPEIVAIPVKNRKSNYKISS